MGMEKLFEDVKIRIRIPLNVVQVSEAKTSL